MTSELFIGLLLPEECPASAGLMAQNFGVTGLRHHSAIHDPGDGGILDCVHGVAAVQGITNIEVLVFKQMVAGGALMTLMFGKVSYFRACPCPSFQVCASSESKCSKILLSCSVSAGPSGPPPPSGCSPEAGLQISRVRVDLQGLD
ncbi:hypothetical protein P7K49_004639 [Saguinus oedipus]|uniref:Uncharacterized protein n=1 Tax=Saguinus oedipus TaxID=9490 RepID=A0ABQ9W802_SAGOE|nr:hypothetical protein P7K49_004639 [Saguinus oedipus]